MDRLFDLFDHVHGLGFLAAAVPIAGFILTVVVRMVLGRVVGGLFGSLSRFALDKPIPAATLTSTPTDGPITLRQILDGQLGQTAPTAVDPAERVKVLEELHAQGGISADKLARLKAAIAAGS